jgi:hypothetical protein
MPLLLSMFYAGSLHSLGCPQSSEMDSYLFEYFSYFFLHILVGLLLKVKKNPHLKLLTPEIHLFLE